MKRKNKQRSKRGVWYVQHILHENLTHEERMKKVQDDCHHSYYGSIQEVDERGNVLRSE